MPFDFHSRYGLFTYAHVDELDPFCIVEHFSSLGGECIVAAERYPTGPGVHYHVFTDFGRKFRSRRVDCFDVAGFHPNIVASRGTPEAGYDYAIKDGDVVAGGLERPSGVEPDTRETKWHRITSAATREEFFHLLRTLDPKSLVTNHRSCIAFADWQYRVEPTPYATPNGVFNLAEYGDLSESRSLVLFGDTRLGKTVWSRSLGPHVYFCGLYSYAEAVKAPDVDYAVFDDIQGGIKFFPAFKNWLGCQMEFQVKGLYRDPQLLKWGKPSIWVANTDPRHDMTHDDIKWMEGNCIFVEIVSAIFHASTGYPACGETAESP
ncbi:replication associated protein [Alces alces faeces associated genomovirus MP157]|uniref:Replication associated protein n=1 Tax=Alces alces faeces associated genomovirus MP157 TaxID=2219113 RepID=A0A2Z5CJA5_9VIRU|nr:replication associated protein [Alces alces faeces associated genomovirus MP157]AXB22630.1 replication associated protein [Alces alces faeces associated genomovirus MP157]